MDNYKRKEKKKRKEKEHLIYFARYHTYTKLQWIIMLDYIYINGFYTFM